MQNNMIEKLHQIDDVLQIDDELYKIIPIETRIICQKINEIIDAINIINNKSSK